MQARVKCPRGPGKPETLTGGGAPIIGIHVRRGIVVDALALVVNREKESPAK